LAESPIVRQIRKKLDLLPIEKQQQVLAYIQSLLTPLPPGASGKAIAQFAGMIESAELEKMSRAIKDQCESVDEDEW
jgi:hypothetical protein